MSLVRRRAKALGWDGEGRLRGLGRGVTSAAGLKKALGWDDEGRLRGLGGAAGVRRE